MSHHLFWFGLHIHNMDPSTYYYIFEWDGKFNELEAKNFNFLIQTKKAGIVNLSTEFNSKYNGYSTSIEKIAICIKIMQNLIVINLSHIKFF